MVKHKHDDTLLKKILAGLLFVCSLVSLGFALNNKTVSGLLLILALAVGLLFMGAIVWNSAEQYPDNE